MAVQKEDYTLSVGINEQVTLCGYMLCKKKGSVLDLLLKL